MNVSKEKPIRSIDQHLREFGYRIVSRPRAGEPMWRSVTGAIVKQSDALALIALWLSKQKAK